MPIQPGVIADLDRREKWDRRFIDLMNVVGGWSKDPSTKVGAVIVRPDGTVASIGYNGFPRGIADTEERLNHRETKYSLIVHGEINAILNAHGPVNGYTLYVPFPPCDRCAVQVVQAGIARVVYVEPGEDIKSRWAEAFVKTAAIFAEAGIEVTELPALPPYSPCHEQNVTRIRIDIPASEGRLVSVEQRFDMRLLEALGHCGPNDDSRFTLARRLETKVRDLFA